MKFDDIVSTIFRLDTEEFYNNNYSYPKEIDLYVICESIIYGFVFTLNLDEKSSKNLLNKIMNHFYSNYRLDQDTSDFNYYSQNYEIFDELIISIKKSIDESYNSEQNVFNSTSEGLLFQYKNYGIEKYDLYYSNPIELLYFVNTRKQEELLDNYLIIDATKPGCEEDCDGWYISNHRCECGNYKDWCWDDSRFNPLNWEYININSIKPYGHLTDLG